MLISSIYQQHCPNTFQYNALQWRRYQGGLATFCNWTGESFTTLVCIQVNSIALHCTQYHFNILTTMPLYSVFTTNTVFSWILLHCIVGLISRLVTPGQLHRTSTVHWHECCTLQAVSSVHQCSPGCASLHQCGPVCSCTSVEQCLISEVSESHLPLPEACPNRPNPGDHCCCLVFISISTWTSGDPYTGWKTLWLVA